jgi:hypothetical protein
MPTQHVSACESRSDLENEDDCVSVDTRRDIAETER